jgi:hypothetical protein
MKQTSRNDTSAKKRFAKSPKKEPKKATKGTYNSIDYDSLEELAMLQWLFELKSTGYIKSIKRAQSYLLCDSYINSYVEQRKVSSKPCVQTMLHGHSYTPEFEVIWDPKKSRDRFVWDTQESTKCDKLFVADVTSEGYRTIIEVKPSFDQNNMERLFKLNQKWMWDKYAIFVNLVKVNDLFPKTFTPKAYLTTPSGKARLLKWKHKSLFQYLNDK